VGSGLSKSVLQITELVEKKLFRRGEQKKSDGEQLRLGLVPPKVRKLGGRGKKVRNLEKRFSDKGHMEKGMTKQKRKEIQ